MRQRPHRLVFLDETATTTKMTRLRGRALKGKRLQARAPYGHWRTQTFIAALRCDGLTAPWVVDRPMNRRIFEAYVRVGNTQKAPGTGIGLYASRRMVEAQGGDLWYEDRDGGGSVFAFSIPLAKR